MSAWKSGFEDCRAIGSAAPASPASKRALASQTSSPPAEKPSAPTRAGSMPHSTARLRMSRNARWVSASDSTFDLVSGTLFARESVLEHEGGDAPGTQPFADCIALVRDRQEPVAAAGDDQHRRTRRRCPRRQERRHARMMDAGDAALTVGGDDDGLRGRLAGRARRAIGPERNRGGSGRLRRGRAGDTCRQEGCERQQRRRDRGSAPRRHQNSASRVSASPKAGSSMPIRSMIPRYRLHSFRSSSSFSA